MTMQVVRQGQLPKSECLGYKGKQLLHGPWVQHGGETEAWLVCHGCWGGGGGNGVSVVLCCGYLIHRERGRHANSEITQHSRCHSDFNGCFPSEFIPMPLT